MPSGNAEYAYVRFSAQNYPECTLRNGEGIAMSPFVQAIGATAKQLQQGIQEKRAAHRQAIRERGVALRGNSGGVSISTKPTRESINMDESVWTCTRSIPPTATSRFAVISCPSQRSS